jgi:DNA-binding protein H-NS
MNDYQSLLKQREALDLQIEQARKNAIANAVQQCKALISEHGLSAADLFGSAKASKAAKSKVAPKYRDPATNATWTGRGKPPLWIQGKDREAFAI